MKIALHHGRPTIRQGEVGSHVALHFHAEADGEWDGVYHFPSHGLTAQQVFGKVQDFKSFHAMKVRRLNGFVELRKRKFVVNSEMYCLGDCTVRHHGTDIELLVGVDQLIGDGVWNRVFKMDYRDGLLYPSIDAVPKDDDIEALVISRITITDQHIVNHAAFVNEVRGMMESTS